jgi:hypothetical protein
MRHFMRASDAAVKIVSVWGRVAACRKKYFAGHTFSRHPSGAARLRGVSKDAPQVLVAHPSRLAVKNGEHLPRQRRSRCARMTAALTGTRGKAAG